MSELCEAMGRSAEDRLVVLTVDGLGRSHSANEGVYSALRRGLATSAGLMVPAPWARHAAARYRGEQVGVLLTLIAEADLYRWGPVTSAPSLLDGDGGFPRTLEDLWDHADLDEVYREARAQIERAILWGFDISHLSSHQGAMERRSEFFGVYLELAEEFHLPVRLPSAADQRSLGVPLSELAAQAGVLSPDHVVNVRDGSARATVERALSQLRPGVTELRLRPAVDTPELRALGNDWADRVGDLDVIMDAEVSVLMQRAGAQSVGWGDLRKAMQRRTGN
ncbi:MAG: ChbG/HpnK family deacetylase [Microthrixaceae bacterium]